jgi:integrase
MDMWDMDTIDHFLEVAWESRFCELYQLAILTGLRRSELCGLKWENVDLVARRLSVNAWGIPTLRSRWTPTAT